MKPTTVAAIGQTLRKALPERLFMPVRSIGNMLGAPLRFTLVNSHWKTALLSRAVDAAGNPMPWYTYPMIEFLRQRDTSSCSVLEFGGGQSTLWWARNAAKVVTVESDRDWHDHLRPNVPANVTLAHVPYDQQTRDVSAVASFLEQTGSSNSI